ncbi:ABC transporter ATP-binding protein [Effusibacillus dendaii]|uniref:ABC transporter ATP-binding protein n=1 Tax=Effusibacillus dendaii TaxID=2743772 RepID=A0A7I8D9N4_9BACL|nr:ABC transporter ATP-binding protein [Effusibacillus dendaii]BCJ85240.1 ABC transporter ATP-binding protein [Effusibacillus dendaii]
MIQLQEVSVSFGGRSILQKISLQAEKGQSIGIIGPNGAGKSTLLKVIAGQWMPSQGEVTFAGKPIQSYGKKQLARHIAFMRQNVVYELNDRVYDTVMLGRYPFLKRFSSEQPLDHEICRQSLQRTDTWELRNRYLDQLSGGERQRVLLAQVLAQQPKLLLLDEPTTYLDLHRQVELLSFLKQEQQNGLAWIAVLHDLNLAAQFCDQLVLLDAGKLVQMAAPAIMLRSPAIEDVFQIRTVVLDIPSLHVPQIVVTGNK